MGNNFQDNVVYGNSTLAVSGDAIIVGSTDNGAKSIIFNNSGSQGHLAWQPSANHTINLPDANGTIQLTGQVPGAIYDGANSISSGTIRFTNANGVSFSINGQTISGSVAAQTNQTVGLYGLGNTTQNSSTTLDARSLSFNGLGAATVGYSNGSIQVSAPATSSLSATGAVSISVNGSTISIGVPTQSAQTQSNIQGVSAGTQLGQTGNVVFSNSNGISFGMSNSSVITASYTVPSTAGLISGINVSAGTTSNNLTAFTFSDSNGLAFGLNGSVITGSYTVPVQTNQTLRLLAFGNTTNNSTQTVDARSMSFIGLGGNTIGFSNGSLQFSGATTAGLISGVNLSAGTTSGNLTNFVFSNSNGLSFGLNGSTITATFAQTNQSIGLYALGNTTQNSSTTLDARSLSFNGFGAATVGYSNGSIQLSVATQSNQTLGLFAIGNTTQNSSTTLDARNLSFNGVGAVSVGYSAGSVQVSAPVQAALPLVINGIEFYGHSYFDPAFSAAGNQFSEALNDSFSPANILATALSLTVELIRNHAILGSQLTKPGRSQGGFARVLSEVSRSRQSFPFARSGGGHILCWGINDIGNQTPANQTLLNSTYNNCLTAVISKCRASAIYLAQGAQWSFGANFSNAPAAALDYTSGSAKIATTVDSAGTTTATFTIPLGYQGEPICFNMVGLSGNATMTVTWGGTVTGTSSIIGRTDTLSAIAVNAQSAYPVRFTSTTNGLSSSNAGQTITVRLTTNSGGGTWTLDGCWIESLKPTPVIVCNVPKLECRAITFSVGDGVTTGVNTSLTSATANFLSSGDAGVAITETDAQGAFTSGKTIASVTNATTVVLSGNATGAFTNIKFTVARKVNGYALNYTTNTDFTAATPSSKVNADAAVTNLNTTISTVVAKFDSMVQIADIDTALNSLPGSQVLSYFGLDGLHPNDLGTARMANYIYKALISISRPAADLIDLGALEFTSSQFAPAGPVRRPINSGKTYAPEFGSLVAVGTFYTAVAGDMFAYPIMITEPTISLGNAIIDQLNAPVTAGSNIRFGLYDDINMKGYPQNLRTEPTSGGAFAMGTTSGIKTIGSFQFSNNVRYGLWWLVLKIDSLGTTASQLRQILGPNPYMPNWDGVSGSGSIAPLCWKATGIASGALPTNFPTGAVLVGTAPIIGIVPTVL